MGRDTIVIKSPDPETTHRIGMALGRMLGPGDVVALIGDLGTGKTCLAQGIARGLGVGACVRSPTYTIIGEYSGRYPFYHMDAYRLSGPRALDSLGTEDYFYGNGVTVVEWADKIEGALPDERLEIRMEYSGCAEEERILRVSSRGKRFSRVIEELRRLCGSWA